MRGRRHGEAVTDEVGQFRLRGTVHLISRLRRQLPLIGEAIDRKDSDKEISLQGLQGVEDAGFVAAFVAVAGVDAGADEAVAQVVPGG